MSVSVFSWCLIGSGDMANIWSVVISLISRGLSENMSETLGNIRKTRAPMSYILLYYSIYKRPLETNRQAGAEGGNLRTKANYPASSQIHYSLLSHVTKRADDIDMPWSDPPFDRSRFIVLLIIINHLNMLSKLTL